MAYKANKYLNIVKQVREEFEEEKFREQSIEVDNFETNNSVLVFEEKNHFADKEIVKIQQQKDFEETISEDMAKQLNPDAKEFVPSSPLSSDNTSINLSINMNGSNGDILEDELTEDQPTEIKSDSVMIFPSSVNQHSLDVNSPTDLSSYVKLETIQEVQEIQECVENLKLSDNEETKLIVQENMAVKIMNASILENSIYVEKKSSEIENDDNHKKIAETTESHDVTETESKFKLVEAAAAVGIATAATLAAAATVIKKNKSFEDSSKVKTTVSTTVKDKKDNVKPKDELKVPAPEAKKVSKTTTVTKKLPTTGAVSKATKTDTSSTTTSTTTTQVKKTQLSTRSPAQASSVASKRPSATCPSPSSALQQTSMVRTVFPTRSIPTRSIPTRSIPTRSIPTRSVQDMKVTSKPSAISKVKLEKTTTIKKISASPIETKTLNTSATGGNSSSTNKPKVGVTAKPISFVPKQSLTKAPVAKSSTINSAEANRKKTDVTKNTQDGNKLTKPTAAKPLSFFKKSLENPTSTTSSSSLAAKSSSADIKPRKTTSLTSSNLLKDKKSLSTATTQKVSPLKTTKSALSAAQSGNTTTNKMNGTATKNKKSSK